VTPDEIIAMAKEAGFPFNKYGLLQGDDEGEIDADAAFVRFAALVAAKAAADEREACCDPDITNSADICAADMPHVVVQKYQAAIRARGAPQG
jgi:hypothetical protein